MKTTLITLRDELLQAQRTSNSDSRKDVYQSIIDRIDMEYLEIEKEQLCDFYIRGRNEQHLDYYPEKHANEEYDLVFNKKEDGQD